jgi:hypothetical protein
LESGLLEEESYNLMVKFLKMQSDESWKKMLKLYLEMKKD